MSTTDCPAFLAIVFTDTRDNAFVELCAAAWPSAREVSRRFHRHGRVAARRGAADESPYILDLRTADGTIVAERPLTPECVEEIVGGRLRDIIRDGRRRLAREHAEWLASLGAADDGVRR